MLDEARQLEHEDGDETADGRNAKKNSKRETKIRFDDDDDAYYSIQVERMGRFVRDSRDREMSRRDAGRLLLRLSSLARHLSIEGLKRMPP